MSFGFYDRRGINAITDLNGNGFYYSLIKDNKIYDRVFYNVGQKDQNPPFHYYHKDIIDCFDNIKFINYRFKPFLAEYYLDNNYFFIKEIKNKLLFYAKTVDYLTFYKIKDESSVIFSNFISETPIKGEIKFSIKTKSGSKKFIYSINKQKYFPAIYLNLTRSNLLKNKLYVVVNKMWLYFFENMTKIDPENLLMFGWDTAFSSIILAETSLDLAITNLNSLFEFQQEDGRIPQLVFGKIKSDRTSPPIWFLAAEIIYKKTNSIKFLKNIYDKLHKNYQWFKNNRMNNDYTFSWGTSFDKSNPFYIKGKIGAAYESGMDDSPIYEIMNINNNGLLDYSCIDLTSLMIKACYVLKNFSKIINIKTSEFDNDIREYKNSFRNFFYIENNYIKFVNSYKKVNNETIYLEEIAPIVFYPLLIPREFFENYDFFNTEIFSRLLDEHFKVKTKQDMILYLPSISKHSKYYNPDGDYWKGRIWAPHIYLVAKGFLNFNMKREFLKLKRTANFLFRNSFKEYKVYENYSALTGMGPPEANTYARSCPLYSWGNLLNVI